MSPLSHQPPFFFFNDTATTEIYTLSLHDALPISAPTACPPERPPAIIRLDTVTPSGSLWRKMAMKTIRDRKSTRLNSSHSQISYAVFCLKKKIKDRLALVFVGGAPMVGR